MKTFVISIVVVALIMLAGTCGILGFGYLAQRADAKSWRLALNLASADRDEMAHGFLDSIHGLESIRDELTKDVVALKHSKAEADEQLQVADHRLTEQSHEIDRLLTCVAAEVEENDRLKAGLSACERDLAHSNHELHGTRCQLAECQQALQNAHRPVYVCEPDKRTEREHKREEKRQKKLEKRSRT